MNMTIEAVEQLRATIYRLRDEGRRPVEIARLAGCALSTVCRALASPSLQDRRRQNGRPVPPDRVAVAAESAGRASELGGRDDGAALDGDPYAGVGVEDYGVAAAADPDSLVPEVTLLRAYIRTTARGVVAATGDERRQAQLMLRTGGLIDVLARVFRASRRGGDSRDGALEQLVGEIGEEMLTAAERRREALVAPAPRAEAADGGAAVPERAQA